jgi:hypothetical protein
MWLPDGGTVLEEMLLLHERPEGGVGQVASGAGSRLRDCGGQDGSPRPIRKWGKLLSQGGGHISRGVHGPGAKSFRAETGRIHANRL